MRRYTILVLAILVSTIAVPESVAKDAPLVQARCDVAPLTWTKPRVLGSGFEPSIELDRKGTIFVTGAAGSPGAEDFSSPLWRSPDDGRTFKPIRRNDMSGGMPGFEGDIAVDGKDRLYFVDTWVGDSYMQRFVDRGKEQDLDRAAVPTGGIDDRPWLAAHGDGIVYYMSNGVVGAGGRQHVLRSTDGGQTFEQPGHYIPNSGIGFIDADPNSENVYVSTNHQYSGGPGEVNGAPDAVEISISSDQGATWSQKTIAEYELPLDESRTTGVFSPIVAVSPKDGSVYVMWTEGSRVMRLAHSRDHGKTWAVNDITPFDGAIGLPWIDLAPDGTVGISFFADAEAVPGEEFSVYAMLLDVGKSSARKRGCPFGLKALGVVPGSESESGFFQRDFFQLAFGPDNDLHLAFTVGEIVQNNPVSGSFVRSVAYTQADL